MPESPKHHEKHAGSPSLAERIRLLARGSKLTEHKSATRPVTEATKQLSGKARKPTEPIVRQSAPARPIEQVLVGAWNAVQPESQGKAIVRVFDRWFVPKYKTEEEKKRAALLRPKIEKAVGWIAVGAEAALITAGIVKGYQMLRRTDRSSLKKIGDKVLPVDVPSKPVTLADMKRLTVPSRREELIQQGALEDYRMFQVDTIVPKERVPYMKEILPTITVLADRIQKRHALVDEKIVSALARAQCGFLGVPRDMEKDAALLAYLGEWVRFGARPDDPEILHLRRLLPNPNTWAFPAPAPDVPLKAIEELFVAFDRKNSFNAARPEKVGAFSRWANIGFPALDNLLGLHGAERVHGEQRMRELYDAWKAFGWLLTR